MLNEKIQNLKKKLIEEASLVDKMLKNASEGLIQRDKLTLTEVINVFEPQINELEIEIDELCISLIALYQPEASNLRTILMILKMNNDLERIGDLVVNIAESSLFLIEKLPVKPLIDIPRMAEITKNMLKDALEAFINRNANLSKLVCEKDVFVNNLRDQILRELITFMSSDPSTIERAIHLIRISRALERIADLSTNIAEDVIFMLEGRIIKHGKDSC